jgi:hypothetical protein
LGFWWGKQSQRAQKAAEDIERGKIADSGKPIATKKGNWRRSREIGENICMLQIFVSWV